MGREVGRGFRMGARVYPWLIHGNVWQEPVHYCKVVSLHLKQIIKKNTKLLLVTYHTQEKKIHQWMLKLVGENLRIISICLGS